MGSNLRSGRDCWWGEWLTSTLSTLNTTTEVSLSKAPNPQLLPGRWSNGCPLLGCVHSVCVHYSLLCVHLDGLNAEDQFRVWVTILDNTSQLLLIIIIIIIIIIQDANKFVSSSEQIWWNLALDHQWILCSEWVPSEWESKQLIKTSQ